MKKERGKETKERNMSIPSRVPHLSSCFLSSLHSIRVLHIAFRYISSIASVFSHVLQSSKKDDRKKGRKGRKDTDEGPYSFMCHNIQGRTTARKEGREGRTQMKVRILSCVTIFKEGRQQERKEGKGGHRLRSVFFHVLQYLKKDNSKKGRKKGSN